MDSDTLKFFANFVAKKMAAYLAATLVTMGALHSGSDQTQFVTMGTGVIVGVLAFVWSWWNDRGKQAVLAQLSKAHGLVSQSTSTTAASNALIASVNDNKVVPLAGNAVKIATVLALMFCMLQAVPAFAQPTPATKAKPTTTQAQANPLLVIQQFTIKDLQAALSDAQANNDNVSAPCYQALLALVQAKAGGPLPAGVGLFQAVQKARDAKALILNLQSPTGALSSLNVACAPLVVDAQTTLVQLGILAGGVAAKVGLTLPLGLPALP